MIDTYNSDTNKMINLNISNLIFFYLCSKVNVICNIKQEGLTLNSCHLAMDKVKVGLLSQYQCI